MKKSSSATYDKVNENQSKLSFDSSVENVND